jgi:hypothetical protein
MHDQIQEESGTSFGVSKTSPQNDFAPHTMANEVWVELVIDGKNVGQAFQVELTLSDKNNIDDLKRAIVNQTPELSSLSIGPASLLVYPPETNLSVEGVVPLPPTLPLLDPGFQNGIAGHRSLIVTAKSRPQQQQTAEVKCTPSAGIFFSVLRPLAFRYSFFIN